MHSSYIVIGHVTSSYATIAWQVICLPVAVNWNNDNYYRASLASKCWCLLPQVSVLSLSLDDKTFPCGKYTSISKCFTTYY